MHLKRFARISLHFMLDPVQLCEFENGLLSVESTVAKGYSILTYGMHQLVCDNTNMVTTPAKGDCLASNRSISFPNFG